MRLKFWGVRGSTPTPERRNSRYGGNTPCVEIRLANGTLLILDCGSGLRALGKSLAREFGSRPVVGYIFMSHFHWDHIQGIPFFVPLYKKGNAFFFHSVSEKGRELEHAVEGQMVTPYFPVDMSIMGAVRNFYEIGMQAVDVNGAVITSTSLNHPQGCVAYRVEADGGVIVYATDTEPGSKEHDENVRRIARDADIFIYDCQYTREQLEGPKKGWGHSCWHEGVRIARDAGAKGLVMFHHDPDNDDSYVDKLLAQARTEFPATVAAAEGMVIEVPSGKLSLPQSLHTMAKRSEERYAVSLPMNVAWKNRSGEVSVTQVQAYNVSKSGVYFVAPKEIVQGEIHYLDFSPPWAVGVGEDICIRFGAKVTRQEELSPEGHPGLIGMGVRILDALPAGKAAAPPPHPRKPKRRPASRARRATRRK